MSKDLSKSEDVPVLVFLQIKNEIKDFIFKEPPKVTQFEFHPTNEESNVKKEERKTNEESKVKKVEVNPREKFHHDIKGKTRGIKVFQDIDFLKDRIINVPTNDVKFVIREEYSKKQEEKEKRKYTADNFFVYELKNGFYQNEEQYLFCSKRYSFMKDQTNFQSIFLSTSGIRDCVGLTCKFSFYTMGETSRRISVYGLMHSSKEFSKMFVKYMQILNGLKEFVSVEMKKKLDFTMKELEKDLSTQHNYELCNEIFTLKYFLILTRLIGESYARKSTKKRLWKEEFFVYGVSGNDERKMMESLFKKFEFKYSVNPTNISGGVSIFVNTLTMSSKSFREHIDQILVTGQAIESLKVPVLEMKVDNVENLSYFLRRDVYVIAKKIDVIETKVTSIEKKVDSIEKKVDAIETEVVAIEKKVDAIETIVTDIETITAAIEAKVTAIETIVTAIETITADIETIAAAIEAKVTAIETKVTAIEKKS